VPGDRKSGNEAAIFGTSTKAINGKHPNSLGTGQEDLKK